MLTPNPSRKDFAELLKWHMEVRCSRAVPMPASPVWSQDELSQASGIGVKTIGKYVHGATKPDAVMLGKLLAQFGLVDIAGRPASAEEQRLAQELRNAAAGHEQESEPPPQPSAGGSAKDDSPWEFPRLPAELTKRALQVRHEISMQLEAANSQQFQAALSDFQATLFSYDPATFGNKNRLMLLMASFVRQLEQGHAQGVWSALPAPQKLLAHTASRRMAKLLFALAWSEAAWVALQAQPIKKFSHEISDGPLLLAGHQAALGLDFELPFRDARLRRVIDLNAAIDAGGGTDRMTQVENNLAARVPHLPMPAAGASPETQDRWRKDVRDYLLVRRLIDYRAIGLVEKIAPAHQVQIDELHQVADEMGLLAQAHAGAPGSYLLPPESTLLTMLLQCHNAVEAIP